MRLSSSNSIIKEIFTFFTLIDVQKSLSFNVIDETCTLLIKKFNYDFQKVTDVSIEVVFDFCLSPKISNVIPAREMLLEQKPFMSVFIIFGVENLKLLLGPKLFVDSRVEMIDKPESIWAYLYRHSTSVLSNPCFFNYSEAFFHFLLLMV